MHFYGGLTVVILCVWHARNCLTRRAVGPTCWPTLGWGPRGFEDLPGPLLRTKNHPHPIMLTLSSQAHEISLFIWMFSRSNGLIQSDLSEFSGHVYYKGVGFFWSTMMDWKVGPTRGAHYVHRAQGIIFPSLYM